MNEQPIFSTQTSRRKLIRNSLGFGIPAALFGNKANVIAATTEVSAPKIATANDSHPELSKRIATLDARGGGTLELGDGVYEISETLRLSISTTAFQYDPRRAVAKAKMNGSTTSQMMGNNTNHHIIRKTQYTIITNASIALPQQTTTD